MAHIDLNDDNCVGCSACVNACPQACITLVANERGFLIPEVEVDKCMSCGICIAKCPEINPPPTILGTMEKPRAYAAYSKDIEVRYTSTSGGIFTEVATSFIQKGGYVAGAIYDENLSIRHHISNDISDIPRLRQSKYAQSDKGNTYNEIKHLLRNGNKVLFVGTPCETAGLVSFLGSSPAELVLIDFICLGVNSPLVYRKYISWLESVYKSKATRIWFKYKAFGWERFSTRVDFLNGKQYVRSNDADPYMKGFLKRTLYLRQSCYTCKHKGFPRFSDITLGDFWGVGSVFPHIDRVLGVSAVCVNTSKGADLFNLVMNRLAVYECDLDQIAAHNKNIYIAIAPDKDSAAFYHKLDTSDFQTAINAFIQDDIFKKCKKAIKNVIYLITHGRALIKNKRSLRG